MPFFRKEVLLAARVQQEKVVLQYGITNRCKDGLYVLFLDYDKSPESWIREEITLLQGKFSWLGEAHLFKTKHGHHVVFLEKSHLHNMYDAMRYTSCDTAHREIPMRWTRRAWVLRQSNKDPDKSDLYYIDTIESPFGNQEWRVQSLAHRLWLTEHWGVPTTKTMQLTQHDAEYELEMAYYHTPEEHHDA